MKFAPGSFRSHSTFMSVVFLFAEKGETKQQLTMIVANALEVPLSPFGLLRIAQPRQLLLPPVHWHADVVVCDYSHEANVRNYYFVGMIFGKVITCLGLRTELVCSRLGSPTIDPYEAQLLNWTTNEENLPGKASLCVAVDKKHPGMNHLLTIN